MAFLELLGKKYTLRHCRVGDEIICAVHGMQVVGGFCGPRSWPRAKVRGRPQLIVCDGLLQALRVESREAIAFHWGVHVATVANWRRALGLTHQIADAVTHIKRQMMHDNRQVRPESFVYPGVKYLETLTEAQRKELGWISAGNRKWSDLELKQLNEEDAHLLSERLQRSINSIRSARYRLAKRGGAS